MLVTRLLALALRLLWCGLWNVDAICYMNYFYHKVSSVAQHVYTCMNLYRKRVCFVRVFEVCTHTVTSLR